MEDDNNVTGPVRETLEKPTPNPYWRSSVSPHLLLPPDVVSDSAYTICWAGVVSPVVCTSGAQLLLVNRSEHSDAKKTAPIGGQRRRY